MPARVLLAVVLATGACRTSDIGQPCPALLGDTDPASSDGGRTETQEVVGYDPTFPCESLTCVATAGRSGYCSKGCRDDASCPRAFECRVIQPVGAFAGQEYCAWKPCQATSDCGPKSEYCCRSAVGADPLATKYCDFSHGDDCE